MKTCKKCGKNKPESEFYLIKGGPKTYGACKVCTCKRTRKYRAKNFSYYKALDKERDKDSARRKKKAERTMASRLSNTLEGSCHNKYRHALRKGKLNRPKSCSSCGLKCTPHGHHDSHEKPFNIMWLCPSCHSKRHVEIGKVKTLSLECVK